jgi:hypothetical protein
MFVMQSAYRKISMNMKNLVILLTVSFAQTVWAQNVTITVQISKTTFQQDGMQLRWKNFDSKAVGAKLSHRSLGAVMYEEERADFLLSVLNNAAHGPYTDQVDAEFSSKKVQVTICSTDHCDYGRPCEPRCHYSPGLREVLKVHFSGQTFYSTEEGVPSNR